MLAELARRASLLKVGTRGGAGSAELGHHVVDPTQFLKLTFLWVRSGSNCEIRGYLPPRAPAPIAACGVYRAFCSKFSHLMTLISKGFLVIYDAGFQDFCSKPALRHSRYKARFSPVKRQRSGTLSETI